LPSTTGDTCWTAVAAHYDSIPANGNYAPGAEDNGSGTAAMMLAAEQSAKLTSRKCTMVFIAFTGEEEGLYGSQEFVKSLVERDQEQHGLTPETCRGVYILDEVAYVHSEGSETSAIFETKADKSKTKSHSNRWGSEQGRMLDIGAAALASLVPSSTANAAETSMRVSKRRSSHAKALVNYRGFGSDHISFMDECMPAVLIIDEDNMYFADHYGHTTRDDLTHINYDHGAMMASVAFRSVEHLANKADNHQADNDHARIGCSSPRLSRKKFRGNLLDQLNDLVQQ